MDKPVKKKTTVKSLGLFLLKSIGFVSVLVCLLVIMLITPIFAKLSVGVLNIYSNITLTTPTIVYANVLLGGGLTKDKDGNISLNHYTRSRADMAITLAKQKPLPIITSGAESPWLQDYLKKHLKNILIIGDNASMNTCENAVFTAKLMTYHELPKSVNLITDPYHMARSRRQFASMGIDTKPIIAPLYVPQTYLPMSKEDIRANLVHTRRALYEIIALGRDVFAPQPNCRSEHEITLEEISTPRRAPKVFY